MADLPRDKGRWPYEHDIVAQEAGYGSWILWCEALEEEKGSKICGGRLSARGRPCRRQAGWGTSHLGSGRCRKHQGRPPMVPRALLAAESQAMRDGELLSVRDQMITARDLQGVIISELETADIFTLRARAGDAHGRIRRAIKSKDPEALNLAMRDLESALGETGSVVDLYSKLESSIDLIRRLAESEARILKIRHDMVSREQLVHLMGRVSRAFRGSLDRNVPDDRVRRLVMMDFADALSDVFGEPEPMSEGTAA